MKLKPLRAALALGALALAGTAGVAQPSGSSVEAELSGRGATGHFAGTVRGEDLCYRLHTRNLANARNPRLVHVSGNRMVRLLPMERNVSDGCVRIGQHNARLIRRDPADFFVYVAGENGGRSLQGQLR